MAQLRKGSTIGGFPILHQGSPLVGASATISGTLNAAAAAISGLLTTNKVTTNEDVSAGTDGWGGMFIQRGMAPWEDVLQVWRGGSLAWTLRHDPTSGYAKFTSGLIVTNTAELTGGITVSGTRVLDNSRNFTGADGTFTGTLSAGEMSLRHKLGPAADITLRSAVVFRDNGQNSDFIMWDDATNTFHLYGDSAIPAGSASLAGNANLQASQVTAGTGYVPTFYFQNTLATPTTEWAISRWGTNSRNLMFRNHAANENYLVLDPSNFYGGPGKGVKALADLQSFSRILQASTTSGGFVIAPTGLFAGNDESWEGTFIAHDGGVNRILRMGTVNDGALSNELIFHNLNGTAGPSGAAYDIEFKTRGVSRMLIRGDGTDIDIKAALKINGTQVFDTSRNLSNVGTISSTGDTTVKGTIRSEATGNTSQIYMFHNGTNGYVNATAGTLSLQAGGATKFWLESTAVQIAANHALKMNGTTIVDSSQNATFNTVSISSKASALAAPVQTRSATISATGWYRIAQNGTPESKIGGTRAGAKFIVRDTQSSMHSWTAFYAAYHYGAEPTLTLLGHSHYNGGDGAIQSVRLIEGSTYEGAGVDIYVDLNGQTSVTVAYEIYENEHESGWSPVSWAASSTPAGFSATQLDFAANDMVLATAANGTSNDFYVNRSGGVTAKSTSVSELKIGSTLTIDTNRNTTVANLTTSGTITAGTGSTLTIQKSGAIFFYAPNGWTGMDMTPASARWINVISGDKAVSTTTIWGIERNDTWAHMLDIKGDGSYISQGTASFVGGYQIAGTTVIDSSRYVTTPKLYLTDTETLLSKGSGDSVRIDTLTGYVEVGSQNASYSHFMTDRPKFYFNKAIAVEGGFEAYHTSAVRWTLGTRVNSTNYSPYFSARVDAPAFSVSSNPFDETSGSPWYGLGMSNLTALSTTAQTAVQLAGYFGLRMRTSGATLDLFQNGKMEYTGGDTGTEFRLASKGNVILTLDADTDNVTETDHPEIRLLQDQQGIAARIRLADTFVGGTNGGNHFQIYFEDDDAAASNFLTIGVSSAPEAIIIRSSDGLIGLQKNVFIGGTLNYGPNNHQILNGTDTWIRTRNNEGIYFSTHGTGLYADNSSEVKVYNNKGFYATAYVNTGGKIQEGGNALVPAGSIMVFAGSAAPGGWLMCNGQAVSRTTYANLFAAIGTTYGAGDGSTTFNLPDLRGRVVGGLDNMGGAANANRVNRANARTLGGAEGAEKHLLTGPQSGVNDHGHAATQDSHTHGVTDPGHSHSDPTWTGSGGSTYEVAQYGTPGYDYGKAAPTSGSGTGVYLDWRQPIVSISGSGDWSADEAHENVQPTLFMNYIIKI